MTPPERYPQVRLHPTSLVEDDVHIGPGTSVWDGVHIRHGARLGRDCIVGEKSYIAYDVSIGDRVKINAMVYICAGVTVEDMVMISAGTVFTNDRFPRAFPSDLHGLMTSDPTAETLATVVRRGVTIGANATIGPGIELGEFSMVGMGSVVTRDVEPHRLVVGNPGRPVGWVCACGPRIPAPGPDGTTTCGHCGRVHRMSEGRLRADGV